MPVPVNGQTLRADWAIPMTTPQRHRPVADLGRAQAELTWRLSHRADLDSLELAELNKLGSALLAGDFSLLLSLVNIYAGNAERLGRLACRLAGELRSPDLTILKVNIRPGGSGVLNERPALCVITLRLERQHRLIEVMVEDSVRVQVFAPGAHGASGRLVPVNEDPGQLLRKSTAISIQGPPPVTPH